MQNGARKYGDTTITLAGNAHILQFLVAGGGYSQLGYQIEDFISPGYTARILIEGGRADGEIHSVLAHGFYLGRFIRLARDIGNAEVTVSCKLSPKGFFDFEAIHLSPGADVTIVNSCDWNVNYGGVLKKPAMLLDFQGNASLETLTDSCKVGALRIEGSGNVLRPGFTDQRLYPNRSYFHVLGSAPIQQVGGAKLELRPPTRQRSLAAGGVYGVLDFTPAANARADAFYSDYGEIAVDGAKGLVQVKAWATRLDYPPASGKASQKFLTLTDTMNAIRADNPPEDLKSGEYTVTLLGDYSLGTVVAGKQEFDVFRLAGTLSPRATVTVTGKNALVPDAPVSQLTTGGTFRLPDGSAGVSGATFRFRDLTLPGTVNLIANGTKVIMGEGIVTGRAAGANCNIYGGSYDTSLKAVMLPDKSAGGIQTFTGNTWVEVHSGDWSAIYGGCYGQTAPSGSAVTVTVNGDSTVLLDGTAKAQIAAAGGWAYTGVYSYTVRQNGNRTLMMSGSSQADAVYAGSTEAREGSLREDIVSQGFHAQVFLKGDSQAGRVFGAKTSGSAMNWIAASGAELWAEGSRSVDEVYDFETVHLESGSELTVKRKLGRLTHFSYRTSGGLTEGGTPSMLLDFQGSTRLSLEGTDNVAGAFRVSGEGNTLILAPRGTADAPLTMDTVEKRIPNQRVGDAVLAMEYQPGAVPSPGDRLLHYTSSPQYALVSDYATRLGALAVMSSEKGGWIYLGGAVSVETEGEEGPGQRYRTLADAMNAIGNGTGSYRVIFRKGGYRVTPEDGAALASQGGSAGSITYTSQVVTDYGDLVDGEGTYGASTVQTVAIGAGTVPGDPKSDLFLNSPVSIVKDIRFNYLQEGCSLYTNGHKLTIGPGAEILSDAGYFPSVYGGGKDRPTGSADMTLISGNYAAIYGGGREAGATVRGNVSISFGENAQLHGPLHGGGRNGDVTGAVAVRITGGSDMAADPARGVKNVIVGGGENGSVGSVSLEISGGKANGTIEIAGCDMGKVRGDVHLHITEQKGTPPPKAPLGNIYGASLHPDRENAGTVGGSIDITVTNGKDYGTIQGGSSGLTGVGKAASVTFREGTVNVENIRDFDALNLGVPATALTGTSLTLMGKLQGQGGSLNFWEGSTLTLAGPGTAAGDLVVKDIHTDASSSRSLLLVYKGPGAPGQPGSSVSRPLTVTGRNTSDPGSGLMLGEYGPASALSPGRLAKAGDRLLIFEQPEQADSQDYVSNVQDLDVVVDRKEPGVVKFGFASAFTVSQKGVSHTGTEGQFTQADRPGETVVKTLTFEIKSFRGNDPEEAGGTITGAYVDESPQPEEGWAAGGTVPQTGNEVTVTQDGPGTVGWSGTVTMAVTPPMGDSPSHYYAHVRNGSGQVGTIQLDVHSPAPIKSPAISRDGEGNYTFTVEVQDAKLAGAQGSAASYNASGVKQLGWAVGAVGAAAPAGQDAALAAQMDTGGGINAITLDSPSAAPYEWTFTVPAADLGSAPGERAVYLYAKDLLGNTGVYPIPLNENLIDVQFPLWAGAVALRGGSSPHLVAPSLYVVNLGEKPVKAELTGATLPQGQGSAGEGKLIFTAKRSGPWASNELNLMVKPLAEGPFRRDFPTRSIKDIDPDLGAVNLGTMPGRNSVGHGTGFTFDALYDPEHIILTRDWSQCQLSYRFSLAE